MMKLSAMTRSGFLTKTEEAKKEGVFEETKSSFDPSLLFVREIHLFMREPLLIDHVGGNNEAGLFLDLSLHFRLVKREGGQDMPDRRSRRSLFFRASFVLIVSLFLIRRTRCEKRRFSLHGLFPRGLSIALTSKLLLGEMPELFLPLGLRFLHLLLHLPTLSLLSCLRAHHHPPFLSLRQILDPGSVLP